MKLISWNVAGLRACMKKGFVDFFNRIDADIICLQETKITEEDLSFYPEGYEIFLNKAEKKGYSGTMIYSKIHPLNVKYGMGIPEHDKEGRMITLEFADFFLITLYVPNSRNGLSRLEYRLQWEKDFKNYLYILESKKPVIFCGDLNVVHKEIDIANPKNNINSPGFTKEERNEFQKLLEIGYIDSYRYFYPNKVIYTWWSYLSKAREKNIGWRLDYFVVSKKLEQKMENAKILNGIYGSDHCPIELDIKL